MAGSSDDDNHEVSRVPPLGVPRRAYVFAAPPRDEAKIEAFVEALAELRSRFGSLGEG